jgi:hypothetical protein
VTSSLPQTVLDAADVSAVTQLVLTERESRDLGRWERLGGCYFPDSRVRLSWIDGSGEEFVRGSIEMARRGLPAKHRLGPVLVRLNGARAVASLGAIIDIPVLVGGVQAQLSSHARFLYRAERREDRWGLTGFDSVYVRDEFTTPIPGQAIGLTPEDVARFRPSYRMLSWTLASQGYEVNMDLAGEDRPETVKALEREIYGWAGLEP